MVEIKCFDILDGPKDFRVNCLIEVDDTPLTLWFETSNDYKYAFNNNRIDGIVVMLILRLMATNQDVYSAMPMSQKLHFQLTNYFIPTLVAHSDNKLHNISINCPLVSDCCSNESRVASTGFSGGVDSLFSLQKNTRDIIDDSYKVKLLVVAQTDSVDNKHDYSNRFLINSNRAKEFGSEYGFMVLCLNTNFRNFWANDKIGTGYTAECTYFWAGIALLFSKLIKAYYIADSFEPTEFKFLPLSVVGYHDIFSAPMLSSENTTIYSDGGVTRFNKEKTVSEYPPSYKYLSVCWHHSATEHKNCSKCPKCIRTMAAFDVLGSLEKYDKVFDIEHYKNNYIEIWSKILIDSENDKYYKEIITEATKRGFIIPKKSYKKAKSSKRNMTLTNLKSQTINRAYNLLYKLKHAFKKSPA